MERGHEGGWKGEKEGGREGRREEEREGEEIKRGRGANQRAQKSVDLLVILRIDVVLDAFLASIRLYKTVDIVFSVDKADQDSWWYAAGVEN